jgi:hypothetical protein
MAFFTQTQHNHYIVLRKVLGIISLGLGLEVDT